MRRHILLAVLFLFLVASIAEAKDAVVAYRSAVAGTICSGAANATLCPRVRFWNSSGIGSWGTEVELPSGGSNISQILIRSSPKTNKLVVVTVGRDDNLDAWVCKVNCTSSSQWSYYPNIGTVERNINYTRRFDFEFETATGDLVLVYAVNSTNGSRDLGYKVLPNALTNFTELAELYINDIGHSSNTNYSWISMDRKRNDTSEEIVLEAIEKREEVNAWIWNGTNWANQVEITHDNDVLQEGDYEAIAVAYTYKTGKAMVMSGHDSHGTINYRIWNGTSWSSISSFDINTSTNDFMVWTTMKADPNSDYLLTAVKSNDGNLYSTFWNGSTWNVTKMYSLLPGETMRNGDVDWNSNSTGIIVWGNITGSLSWRNCTPQCFGPTYNNTGFAGQSGFIGIARNPDQTDLTKILGVRINNLTNGQMGSFRWNDTNISNYGDTILTSSSGEQNVQVAFSIEPFAFYDDIAPTVALVAPANDSVLASDSANFTFNATDDMSLSLSCSLYLDGALNQTNSSVINGINTNFSVTGISPGPHSWYVMCYDDVLNSGTSQTWYFLRDTPPVVALNAPANNSILGSSTVDFNFTATDNLAPTMNCSVYLDGTLKQTNSSVSNNTATILSVSGIGDGPHTWNASCQDNNNLTGYSQTRAFTVDTTPPNVTLLVPSDGKFFNTSTILLNYTQADLLSPWAICNLSIDGGLVSSYNATNNSIVEVGISLGDGLHLWNVTCTDDAGNVGYSGTRNFTVDTTAPTVTLVYPENDSFFNVTSVDFNFTATDNLASFMNCSLSIDGFYDPYNESTANNTETTFTVSGILEGTHTWNVSCRDDAGNIGASLIRTFTIDTTPPVVAIQSPQNTSYNVNNTIDLNYSVDELHPDSCWYDLDGTGPTPLANCFTNITPLPELADGSHYVIVYANDSAGNAGSHTVYFSIDTVAPSVILVSPPDLSAFNVTDLNFSFTVTNGDPTVNCSLYIDGLLNQTNETTNSSGVLTTFGVSGLSENMHNWTVVCLDSAANPGAGATFTFTIDLTPPSIALNSPEEGFNTSSTVLAFNFTATDNLDNISDCDLYIDGVVNTSGPAVNNTPAAFLVSGLAEGQHNWSVECADDAGNSNTSETRNFMVDLTPPMVVLNSPVDGLNTSSTFLDFNFTATDAISSTFLCDLNIDGIGVNSTGANNDTPIALSYSGLSEGYHSWNITCTDEVGNDNTSETRTFLVDTTPPWFVLVSPPNGSSFNVSLVYFNLTVNDNFAPLISCTFSLDGNNISMPALDGIPNEFNASVPDGIHYWNATCSDDAGNTNVSDTWIFTADTTPPDVTIDFPLNAFYNTASLDFNFTVFDATTEVDSCWYDLNGEGPTALPGCANTSITAQEEFNTLTLYANDSLGNTGSFEVNFTIDTTPPTVSIDFPINEVYNSTSLDLNYTVEDDVSPIDSCWYSLDGGANTSLPGCLNYSSILSPLSEGWHNVTVYANDTLGNVGSGDDSFFVDPTPPAITLNSPANDSFFNVTSVDFNFTATDNLDDNISCQLYIDGGLFQTVDAANDTPMVVNFPSMGESVHYWWVTCVDDAGNENTSETRQLTVDVTPPTIVITSPLNNSLFDNNTVLINITAADILGPLNCTIDIDGAIDSGTVSNPFNYLFNYTTSDGLHNVSFNCTDGAGNTEVAGPNYFTVDTTPPAVSIESPQNTSYNIDTIDLNYTIGEPNPDSCWYELDGGSATLLANCTNITLPALSNGGHNVTVHANDTAGSEGSSTVFFTIDTALPSVILNAPANNAYFGVTALNFTFTATDNLDSILNCTLYLDSAPNQMNESTANNTLTRFNLSGIGLGTHNWSVQCRDSSGNVGVSATRNFTIDTSAPSVTIISPTSTTYTSHSVALTYTVTDTSPISACWYKLDSGGNIALPSCNNIVMTSVPNGNHNVTVYANDTAGNVGSALQTFKVSVSTGGGGGGGGGGGLSNMYLSYSFLCPDGKMAFNVTNLYGTGITDVNITVVYNEPPYSSVGMVSTVNGSAVISLIGNGTYNVSAVSSNYNAVFNQVEFTGCPHCALDSDCSATEQCANGSCISVECECGEVVDHACQKFACCADSDCPAGQSCIDNECTEYECTSNEDCPATQYCNIPTGAGGGTCEDVTGCGNIVNHALVPYECGTEANCPSCPSGELCVEHSCSQLVMEAPESAKVGDNITVSATENGNPCSRCVVFITLPDGSVVSANMGENGRLYYVVENQGDYVFRLQKGEGAIVSVVSVSPTLLPVPADTTWCWIGSGLLLLLLLLLLFLLWKRRQVSAAVITEKPMVGKPAEIMVSKSKGPVANVKIEVLLNNKPYSSGVSNKFGKYSFVPTSKGQYAIHIMGRGKPDASFNLA